MAQIKRSRAGRVVVRARELLLPSGEVLASSGPQALASASTCLEAGAGLAAPSRRPVNSSLESTGHPPYSELCQSLAAVYSQTLHKHHPYPTSTTPDHVNTASYAALRLGHHATSGDTSMMGNVHQVSRSGVPFLRFHFAYQPWWNRSHLLFVEGKVPLFSLFIIGWFSLTPLRINRLVFVNATATGQ
ncbi:unnamed protein product [Protopolystoma xenopodis]|uniref:Uncharacterized protein n=1 Tax=Protopolystoma xenopodis TaxID=117903 RepID=A0A3S5A5Z9_9PLAT|nr:unnamed protein product [Protopolystoma xenopodis]